MIIHMASAPGIPWADEALVRTIAADPEVVDVFREEAIRLGVLKQWEQVDFVSNGLDNGYPLGLDKLRFRYFGSLEAWKEQPRLETLKEEFKWMGRN